MSTLADIVTDVLAALHTSVGNAEKRTSLSQAITATDKVLVVADPKQVSLGLVQVGDELVWVTAVDKTQGSVTIAPFGRGYLGTTAAAQAKDVEVISQPRFPRSRVKAAVAAVQNQIYPDIFQVKVDTSQTTNPVQVTYALPADCDFVLSVSYQRIGPTQFWSPVRRYNVDRNADPGTFTSGKTIDVLNQVDIGRKLKVAYMAKPGTLTNDADTLAGAGLDEGTRDILKWGAVARLLQEEEASRIQTTTAEQATRDSLVPAGAATNASRAFYALFQQRLQDEASRLRKLYPAVAHTGI